MSVDPDTAWSSIDATSFDPYEWPWAVADRWVRFCTHPDGWQNETSPAEHDEVVRRVTTIIDQAQQADPNIMLVTGNLCDPGASCDANGFTGCGSA